MNAIMRPDAHRLSLSPSAHVDSFTRDNLPPLDQWPVIDRTHPAYQLPERVNAAVELVDRQVAAGHGDRPALIGAWESLTYAALQTLIARMAAVLTDHYGVEPGNRVLIRSANTPRMVALWLAVTRCGAVAVNTMPLLRAGELAKITGKAEISHALCDLRLMGEMQLCAERCPHLRHVISFDGTGGGASGFDSLVADAPDNRPQCDTAADDVALLGFTSGTTGVPKATMHFHRDILAIADGYAAETLAPTPEDVFIGSPPLAFTFGLGGLAVFPLRFGAAAVLLEDARPPALLAAIARYKATICFTAPTAYRAMLNAAGDDLSQLKGLRLAVSAGETLPKAIYEAWEDATGVPILDGIGATEMLHIFITNTPATRRPGVTGRPVAGYQARIVDADGKPLPVGEVGRLAVRGPTGCRYLADERQANYVEGGWNITGDAFRMLDDGSFQFAARADDMIISAGYNIAGPEIEDALLLHPAVAECAVIGAEDPDRGTIVEAHVVVAEGHDPGPALVTTLQDHVKATIAPYKYPRRVVFTESLPKTATGKIQRFRLRETSRP